MTAPDERYSDALTNFDALLVGAGSKACKAFRDGFDVALADATKNGEVDGSRLSLSTLTAGLPSGLGPEARAFVRRTEDEIRYRGVDWARVALVGTLKEYMSALVPPARSESFPGAPIEFPTDPK